MANTLLPSISAFGPGAVAETIHATRIIIRESRELMARIDELLAKFILACPDTTLDFSALAHRYSDWAREQIALVEGAIDHKDMREHAMLAERYLWLAEQELIAAESDAPTYQS
jgi:hypothetical protein